jgi:hypothetical protein
MHPSHYHHPEPTLPIHPAHTGVGAGIMGSAGFGVATGGDVSEEEDESLGMVPGPGAPPRRSFARKVGQFVGETQEGVVRGLWEKEGGYVFPRPRLGREGDGFVVRGGEETESDGDRPRTRTTLRPAGTLQAPIELDQEQVMMPLPGETPADALRRIKGIDLGLLVGGSRGVKVLKPEHGGMHGVRIDERWGHVRSGDVRNRGQQVQRRPSNATVGADADEALVAREKRKRVDEEEGPARKRARKDVEMAIVEQVGVIQDERCETYMPPRARKGWKSFCQRFEQRGARLLCSIINSTTEYTFMGAVPHRSSPRRSPERMEVDSPLPVPVQPQLHHQPQPPSQPLQQFVVVSPQLSSEQLRPAQPHSRPPSQRPAFTSLPSSSHTHNTHSQLTEAPTPRSEILSSALYTPGPPREQLERNHQYPFPNTSLSNTHSNGTKLIHPTPHHVQAAQPTPQVLQMEERVLSPPPVARKISGPPPVQQRPQLVHGRGGSVPQVSIQRPAAPVSVDLLCPMIRIDIVLQIPATQSRSRGGMSLAGMLNSPVHSMRPLPSASTPAAVSAPLPVQQPMSSAFIPLARESSCSGYAFDSTRASLSTGRDSILSSGPSRPRTESTSTVGPSIQNGPMSAGLYPLQPLSNQRTISVGSPPPNASHSRPYSHRPHSVGPRGVLHSHSPPHPPEQYIHAQPIIIRQHPLAVRPRTASSPVPVRAVPSPSRASITPAPPPSLPSRPTGTHSPSTHPLDPLSVSQMPLEVKMEIVECLPMEDAEEPQPHTYSPAAFQVPPSSNSSAMVTPVMVDPPPEPFLIRHKEPSVPIQEAIWPVPAHTVPVREASVVPASCPSPVIPAPRQVSMDLSVASQAPTITPEPISSLRQPSSSPPSRQQSVTPAPAPRQASVAPVLCQPIVIPAPPLPAQGQAPVLQRQPSLVPEPFVTASPAPVYRSPSPLLGGDASDAVLVPSLPGQTPEPPPIHNPEPEQAVRPLTFVMMVPQPRQSLLDDIWSDTAVVVRPESSSSSGMRPPLQPKHPAEKLKVEIPRQDVKMISPASSSPLSSPPDEHDERGSSEVESDEESDEDDDRNEDESMTGSNDEESSEGPFIRIRRGKSTTTVESPLSNSSPPRRLSIAGARTVRNVVLESPEEGEVPVGDDHSSPPPSSRPSNIGTAPSIPPPKDDNLMELDEQPQADANPPPTPPRPLESPKPPTATEPTPTPTTKSAIAPKSATLDEAPKAAVRQASPPKAPSVRRIPFSEYKNRKREQGIQPKTVSLPEITGGSIAPLLGLAASTPLQTPTTTTGPLSGPYSSVLSTPSAMSGLGPFMTGGSTTPIGEPTPVPPKKDIFTSLTRLSTGDPTPPSLISPSGVMPPPTPALSLVNSGSSSQISADPRLRPVSPVAALVVPMKPNGHSSMAPAVVPIVPSVQPAPTAPLRASTTPVLRRTPPTGPKADRERRPPISPRTAPAAPTPQTSARPPPKLMPPTTKEDGEIDPSRPSSPLATPISRQVPRGWEETPKQPRAFKLNGPNTTGSASPASPAVSRDGHSSGPGRANAGWRGGRGGHPPTGPRALRENGPSRSNAVGGGYGPRGPHDRDWEPDRDRDAGWRERDRRDRDRDREWERERRRR